MLSLIHLQHWLKAPKFKDSAVGLGLSIHWICLCIAFILCGCSLLSKHVSVSPFKFKYLNTSVFANQLGGMQKGRFKCGVCITVASSWCYSLCYSLVPPVHAMQTAPLPKPHRIFPEVWTCLMCATSPSHSPDIVCENSICITGLLRIKQS